MKCGRGQSFQQTLDLCSAFAGPVEILSSLVARNADSPNELTGKSQGYAGRWKVARALRRSVELESRACPNCSCCLQSCGESQTMRTTRIRLLFNSIDRAFRFLFLMQERTQLLQIAVPRSLDMSSSIAHFPVTFLRSVGFWTSQTGSLRSPTQERVTQHWNMNYPGNNYEDAQIVCESITRNLGFLNCFWLLTACKGKTIAALVDMISADSKIVLHLCGRASLHAARTTRETQPKRFHGACSMNELRNICN